MLRASSPAVFPQPNRARKSREHPPLRRQRGFLPGNRRSRNQSAHRMHHRFPTSSTGGFEEACWRGGCLRRRRCGFCCGGGFGLLATAEQAPFGRFRLWRFGGFVAGRRRQPVSIFARRRTDFCVLVFRAAPPPCRLLVCPPRRRPVAQPQFPPRQFPPPLSCDRTDEIHAWFWQVARRRPFLSRLCPCRGRTEISSWVCAGASAASASTADGSAVAEDEAGGAAPAASSPVSSRAKSIRSSSPDAADDSSMTAKSTSASSEDSSSRANIAKSSTSSAGASSSAMSPAAASSDKSAATEKSGASSDADSSVGAPVVCGRDSGSSCTTSSAIARSSRSGRPGSSDASSAKGSSDSAFCASVSSGAMAGSRVNSSDSSEKSDEASASDCSGSIVAALSRGFGNRFNRVRCRRSQIIEIQFQRLGECIFLRRRGSLRFGCRRLSVGRGAGLFQRKFKIVLADRQLTVLGGRCRSSRLGRRGRCRRGFNHRRCGRRRFRRQWFKIEFVTRRGELGRVVDGRRRGRSRFV